jgi:hyperosmotically inducible protein
MKFLKSALIIGMFLTSAECQGAGGQQTTPPNRATATQNAIMREVRHELVMIPWYSVFDNLSYSVNGDHVTLMGQVTRPIIKSDAEAAVKSVEGVTSIDNQIEVLPPSPLDDDIRRAEFHSIYSQPSLQRYAEGAIQQIHIIVKNGHVTLEGAVASEADKDVANIQANTVPNVFSVKNNLVVNPGK